MWGLAVKTKLHCEVAIIGAGFGGCLLGIILRKLGYEVVVVDRIRHPRFAIGESSTPIANLIWQQLCDRYDLPRLRPLGEYGSWKRSYPEIPVGLKRGFSYFHHTLGEEFQPSNEHTNELLVAASGAAEDADTHWVRADFDAFVAQEAVRSGVVLREGVSLTQCERTPDLWRIFGECSGEALSIDAHFVVDASGDGKFLAKQLGLRDHVDEMGTQSRGIWAHFEGMPRWGELFPEPTDYPFPCDAAALHHLFEGGWMWQLRFDHGVVSAGFALDPRQFPMPGDRSAAEEWDALMRRLPSVAWQFSKATICSPGGDLKRSGRMQRWIRPAAGPDWALLPTAAGFLDPLHSSGNAHTLSGIERLARIFEDRTVARETRNLRLEIYAEIVNQEIGLLDQLIHGCYAGLKEFPLMVSHSWLYFASAIWCEHRRRTKAWHEDEAFLNAHDPAWRQIIGDSYRDVLQLVGKGRPDLARIQAHVERVRERIAPYNLAELGDPQRHNMHPYPAACQAIEQP